MAYLQWDPLFCSHLFSVLSECDYGPAFCPTQSEILVYSPIFCPSQSENLGSGQYSIFAYSVLISAVENILVRTKCSSVEIIASLSSMWAPHRCCTG
jgi:hypothetical protein